MSRQEGRFPGRRNGLSLRRKNQLEDDDRLLMAGRTLNRMRSRQTFLLLEYSSQKTE